MNLMSKWVKMVNEGTYNFPEDNPDTRKTERNELEADEYESRQSLMADIEKANEKYKNEKQIGEAEDEGQQDAELDDNDMMDIPDRDKDYWDRIQKQIEKIEDGAIRLQVVKTAREIFDRSDKATKGAEKINDVRLEKEMRKIIDDINNGGDSDEDVQKSVEDFQKLLSKTFKSNINAPEYDYFFDKSKNKNKDKKYFIVNYVVHVVRKNKDGGYTVEMDSHGDNRFETEKEAAEFVQKEMSQITNRYHIKPEQFLNLKDTYEADEKNRKSSDIYKNVKSAIPANINRLDPNAWGFIYPNPQNPPEDDNRNFHVEFIIYNASNVAKYPSQEEENKERQRRIDDYADYVSNLDKVITQSEKEHYTKEIQDYIVKLLNTGKEDKVVEILKTVKELKDKSDDELSNTTGDDLMDLSLNKIKYIHSKLEYAVKGNTSKEDEENDDDLGGEFDAKTAKDTKLATDDDIMAAAEEERELADMKNNMEKYGSVDGYATRGDEKQAQKDAREDAEAEERQREKDEREDSEADRREADADDYEGSQNDTGSMTVNMRNKPEGRKEQSTLSMFGVEITKKFMDYLRSKPKSEWPKNAKQVKQMKNQMNREWAE